jgi:hypothetical protein
MIKLLKKIFCCDCVYCILWDEFGNKEVYDINNYKKREKELLEKS